MIEQAPRRPARTAAFDVVSWRTWAATGYLMASFAVGLFWLVFSVTALSVGASLFLIWVGLPILALTMVCWKGGARAERAFIRAALDVDIPSPYRPVTGGSVLHRWRRRAGDPATWRDAGYLLLLGPLGTLWFVLVTTLWSMPFALVSVPFWYRAVPGGARLFAFSGRPLLVVDSLPEALLLAVAGLLVALAVLPLIRGIAAGHAAIARWLLGPRSTSATSSPSSACRPPPTTTAGSWRCSPTCAAERSVRVRPASRTRRGSGRPGRGAPPPW